MAKISGIEHLPVEVFDDIIKHLVVAIGIYRVVALRRVDRKFDAAIMHAICVRRVVDVQDEATPYLLEDMSPAMRARIFLQPPRPTDSDIRIYMSVVAITNQALDLYYTSDDEEARLRRHKITAESICFLSWRGVINFGIASSSLELELLLGSPYHYRHQINGVYQTDWKQQPDLKGADTQAQNLLSAAVLSGNIAHVDAILASELRTALSPTQTSWTPFFCRPLTLAAAIGNLDLVDHLLRIGFRLDQDEGIDLTLDHDVWEGTFPGEQVARHRCHERHSDAVGTRFRRHRKVAWSNIGLCGSHPLFAAAFNGHIHVVHLLLRDEHRLPLDSEIYLRAVLAGALAGRPDIIELILEVMQCSVAEIVHLDLMLIYHSVKGGNVAMVAALEQWGIDLNQPLVGPPRFTNPMSEPQLLFRTQQFSSALQIAASKGDLPMINFLLSRCPDVNYGYPRYNKSPIEFAAQRGHLEAVQVLLDHDADPSSALIGASSTGQVHLIKYLLDRYPSMVDRDYEKAYQIGRYVTGQQALFLATQACQLATMTMLVQAGANPSHGPVAPMSRLNLPSGRRPFEDARERGNEWVVDHLVSLGAKENVLDKDIKNQKLGQRCCNGVRPSKHTWQWMSKY
jgi:ankyrin repeat protein